MSQAGIKKKGYLLKLPVTGIVKKWAKRWCVLFATSHEGVVRIEYYVDEVSEKSQIGKRTIPLRDSSKIQQAVGDKVHPYVFEFTTQLGQHVFAAENQPELDEWMEGIRDAVHEDRMKRKMNKTQTKRATTTSSAAAGTSQPQAQSSNQKSTKDAGYSPAPGGFSKGSTHTASNITSGTYRITLEENETTDELDLHGSFNLVLAPTTLTIADVNTGKPIYKWNYKFLKSFGKQSGRFNFEVGKTPQGGTGTYRCITTCSKEIFGVVNRNIKIIRERLETARREQQPKQQQPRRPDRRSGVVDDTVPGKYHSSQNMEGGGAAIGEPIEQQAQPNQEANLTVQDVANNYSLAGQGEEDIAALYAKVQKPPKGGAPPTSPFEPQQKQGEQQTSPAAAQQQAPAQSTNRFSYDDTLDARDSALIQLDGPLLDVEALSPKKPAPDFSNIMDLELNNDFFSKTASTAATGVDPWGGGGAAQTLGNTSMQSSNPWGAGGGQQFGGGGQQLGGGGGKQFGGGGGQQLGGSGGQQFGGGGGQQLGGGGGQQFGGGGGQQFGGGSGQQYGGGGGGQQYGGGGQQYGGGGQQFGGYGGGFGQPAGGGYGKSTMYGRPAQQGQWGMGGQQQSAAFGRQAAAAQAPAQTQPQAPQKALSQQEFDQLWEELNTNF